MNRTSVDRIISTPKKNMAATNAMTNTMAVVTMVSLREGQVTFETSRRTSRIYCPGLNLTLSTFAPAAR